MAAAFDDVQEADDVGLDVGVGVVRGVAHAGLGGEVDDALRSVGGEGVFDGVAVGEVGDDLGEAGAAFEAGEAGALEVDVVVVVEVVEADDFVAAVEQALGDVRADEAGGSCNQKFHSAGVPDGVMGIIKYT